MEVLNLDDLSNPDSPRRAKKSFKWLLGIFATTTIVVLGTTFASNINLNNNGPIEFGQGIATTVSCQSNPLLITPTETFDNASNTFVLSGPRQAPRHSLILSSPMRDLLMTHPEIWFMELVVLI